MLTHLRGNLITKKPPFITIDVHGVGYELQASLTTICALPLENTEVFILTHMVVREDAHQLYGFLEENERAVFRKLLKISGVGPKLALAILSGMSVANIMQCIQTRDPGRLVKIPGVGKKTAERIIIEIGDKLDLPSTNLAEADAVSALVALGYKQNDAHIAISKLKDQHADSETLIRGALQELVK